MKTREDPNINPIWDRLLGDNTNTGVLRILGGLGLFIVAGGLVFYFLF